MSTRKVRNHYLPAFLLRRFASKRSGDTSRVWQFRRDERPTEPSVKDVGVAKFFYGQPETGIEDRLGVLENRMASVIEGLTRGQPAAPHADLLRTFLWTLAFRTLAFRDQLGSLLADGVKGVVSTASSAPARKYILDSLPAGFEAGVDGAIVQLPAEQQRIARAWLELPQMRQQLYETFRSKAERMDLALAVREIASQYLAEDKLSAMTEAGHIRGLDSLLNKPGAPPGFSPAAWTLVAPQEEHFVLGDSAVFALGPDGEVGSLLRFTESWLECYLPIGPSHILVAQREPGPVRLAGVEVNIHSAALSRHALYSHAKTALEVSLSARIGTAPPLMAPREIDALIEHAWQPRSEGDSPSR